MSERAFDPFEPEETIGKIWHAYASRLGATQGHAEAAVGLAEVERRLGVLNHRRACLDPAR